jgi:hypothetical protein
MGKLSLFVETEKKQKKIFFFWWKPIWEVKQIDRGEFFV